MVQLIKERKIFFILYGIFTCIALYFNLTLEKGDEIFFFGDIRNYFLNGLFRFMSFIVEAWMFIIIAFALVVKDYRDSILIGSTGLATVFITGWLKDFFLMPRPLLYLEQVDRLKDHILVPEYEALTGYSSFPSGHATAAFALCFAVSIIFKNVWVDLFAIIIASLAALSRVYLTNHFLSDIIVGSILGISITIIIKFILLKIALPEWVPFRRQKT